MKELSCSASLVGSNLGDPSGTCSPRRAMPALVSSAVVRIVDLSVDEWRGDAADHWEGE